MEQSVIDRFVSSGLEYDEQRRLFAYADVYSKLLYKEIQTIVDQDELPSLAIYTSKPTVDDFHYQGYISHLYQFYGNESVISSIIEGVQASNNDAQILENPILNARLTAMSNELIISNAAQSINDQDICPLISVFNSYDGNYLVNVGFGLGIMSEGTIANTISFRNKQNPTPT